MATAGGMLASLTSCYIYTFTKLFHFHGIFKRNEIKSAKQTPSPIHLNPLSRDPGSAPDSVFILIYNLAIYTFTKLFHFHGIFKRNEIKSAKQTPTPIHLNPLSRNPGSAPDSVFIFIYNLAIYTFTKLFHFHGIFKRNEIKSAKQTPSPIHLNPLSRDPGSAPDSVFIFIYNLAIYTFTKLFHFHGIFKRNEIKSAKQTPTPIHLNPLSRNPGSAPDSVFIFIYNLAIYTFTKLFHFHGIFKRNEIKSAKQTPSPIHLNPLSRDPGSAPDSVFIFIYNLAIYTFTKLFHFHGIFKRNEIKSAKQTPTPIHLNPLSRDPGSAPDSVFIFIYNLAIYTFTKLFHFHGIFKRNEIKSVKQTPSPLHLNPLSRDPGSAPDSVSYSHTI